MRSPPYRKNQLDISHLAERLPGQPAWPVRVGKQTGLESWQGRRGGAAAGRSGSESRPGRNRLECDIDAYAVAHALAVIDIGAGKAGQVAVIGRSVLGYLVVEGLHPRGVESELLAYLV